MEIPARIRRMIATGALFVVNHSGGKDSQAMLITLRRLVPARQLLVIHASLGHVEWPGTIAHIEATIGGLPLLVCAARKRDGSARTFLNMVEEKFARLPGVSPWPSPNQRQCTSDLKRGPLNREIRRYLKAHPEYGGQVVSCQGIRAGESEKRARKAPLQRNKRESVADRDWWEWLPIFRMTTLQVFASIAEAGERPHWAYGAGMSRLSCSFCIMSSQADLETAARLRPTLLAEYAVTERATGYSFRMPGKTGPRFLDDLAVIPSAPLPRLVNMAAGWRAAA